jgi:hypothetical protein
MSALVILVTLSAVVGFALGISFTCYTVAISGIALALLSAAVLHVQGFGALSGIATVATCLTVNQAAYLAGALFAYRRSAGLFKKQADKEPRDGRDNDVARERQQQQSSPAWFV